MGKTQDDAKNKTHKTLREKLRKKRQQLKQHKKQKRIKHDEYDAEGKKLKFYQQKNKVKNTDGIKEHKLRKHIEKFVDIYEDDVQDFYQLFKNFDEGGTIDIENVDNPNMKKCLKKIFKHLLLKRTKFSYVKDSKNNIKLQPLMKRLVSESIQNYLQNGTEMEQQSSSDEQGQKRIKKIKQKDQIKMQNISKNETIKNEAEEIQKLQEIKLYKQTISDQEKKIMGPTISQEQQKMLSQLFDKQINEKKIGPIFDQSQRQNIQQLQKEEQANDQFNRIFSMASSSNRTTKVNQTKKPNIQDVPDQLLAEGSAKIGQKQEVDYNQIEQYNKIHRPRKLIEEHQEMMNINKAVDNGKRKPFDRERDIVNGRSRDKMNNGVFFDFKDKMTKPKGTNNFL